MQDALKHIRVIDFGQYIAGPFAAMLFADFGADVIRIEPPGGPRFDTPANATWNRGKRSIVLDLKQDEDKETARRLIATADVVIENFRPGVMERLGLGQGAMCAANSRLIYCSLPGFASDDPRAGVKAWEGVIAAASGVFSPHVNANLKRPVYTTIPLSSIFAAYLCATSATIALVERELSGRGQHITVPLFNATFMAFSGKLMKAAGSLEPEPKPKWRHVPCKDGRWFMYIPGNIEQSILAEAGETRPDNASVDETFAKVKSIFLTRSSLEWEEYFAENEVEGITCHTSAEWLEHPVARQSEIIADFDDPVIGRFRGPGICPNLSETPGRVRRPRPAPNQDYTQILMEKRPAALPPKAPLAPVAALQGVKVLDLGIILASPSCGRTLAEFGADVIKIDSPHRNPVNWHNDINRSKRSIILDLKTEKGKAIFWRLVEHADVVLENFRSGVADKMGIGYEAVRARRPGIVYCSVNTFGQAGPYAPRPGREPVAQAISGMQMRYGGDRPALNPYNANDYGTGLIACFGVAMALLHSRRTGRGQHIQAALVQAATMLQSNLLQAHNGKKWDEPRGQEALGESPCYRAYQASDHWIFLATRPEELALCAELADLAGKSGGDLETAFAERIRSRPAAAWVSTLVKAGIGAHEIVLKLPDMMEDPLVRAQGLSITREHQELGLITTTGPAMKLSRTPPLPGKPASKPGADAGDILGELGMRDQLEALIGEGVVVVDGILPGGAS